ncbi:MAG: YHS domain-containing protein [Burkholderiales bacterium]|nr:YHS domain-containing protein [Burkholderiales bacterium]
MDAESLKSLAWLVVWGGLFYVMMRYGCGAHMMGHGRHRDAGAAAGGSGKDPACGMMVDPEHAKAAAVRDGKTYYFCSDACRNKFEQEPAKFIKTGSQEAHHA